MGHPFKVLLLMLVSFCLGASLGRAADLKYPGDVNWAKPLVRYADYGNGHVVGVLPFTPRFTQEVAISTMDVVTLDKNKSPASMRSAAAPYSTAGTGTREAGGPIQLFIVTSATEPPRNYPQAGGPLGRNQAVSLTLLVAKVAKPRMYSEEDGFYCGPAYGFWKTV